MERERCPDCGRRRAGRGTTHRGEGQCWECEGLPSPNASTTVERGDVLVFTLASCARQRLPFEYAWKIATLAALTDLERDQQLNLLRGFLARRDRLARWYATRGERAGRGHSRAVSRESVLETASGPRGH